MSNKTSFLKTRKKKRFLLGRDSIPRYFNWSSHMNKLKVKGILSGWNYSIEGYNEQLLFPPLVQPCFSLWISMWSHFNEKKKKKYGKAQGQHVNQCFVSCSDLGALNKMCSHVPTYFAKWFFMTLITFWAAFSIYLGNSLIFMWECLLKMQH